MEQLVTRTSCTLARVPPRILIITGPRSRESAVREAMCRIEASASSAGKFRSPNTARAASGVGGNVSAPENSLTLRSPSSAEFESALEQFRPEIILLFGGDGTLNRHLASLVEAQVPVLLVPTGSGNDFALAAGIPSPGHAFLALNGLLESTSAIADSAVNLDLGEIEFADGAKRPFSCCVNVGLDADAARRTNGLPDWLKSRGGYFLGGVAAVFGYTPGRIALAGDGVPRVDETAWFVCVSNTPTYGGGLRIAPDARLDDGLLDITVARRCSRSKLLRSLPRVLNGTHRMLDIVTTFRVPGIEIATGASQPVFADGEEVGVTPIRIRVRTAAIQVMQGMKQRS